MTLEPILAALIVSVGSLGGVLWSHHITKGQIQELHLTFNSKMDRLLEEVKKAAFAEGRQQGGDEARQQAVIAMETAKKEEKP